MVNPEPDKNDPASIKNSDGLTYEQIMGRCSKCHNHGTIDTRKTKLPPHVIDAILGYKIVPRIFCMICMKQTEFIPTEVKKYKDVPQLAVLQKQVVEGVKPMDSRILDASGNPISSN